jgi:hypothetical protein
VGDTIQNISNATIINRSVVSNFFNKLDQRDPSLGNAFKQVEAEIEKSKNPAAGVIYESLVKEAAAASI